MNKKTKNELEKSMPLPIPTSDDIEQVFRNFGKELKDLKNENN